MKKSVLIFVLSIITASTNAQWTLQISGTVDYLTSVYFPSSNVGYISRIGGNLLKTTNGGSSWNILPAANVGGQLYFTSIDTGYALGAGGVLKTVDGGATWIDNFPYTNISECKIHFPTKNVGYVITQNIAMDSIFTFKTINAGVTWTIASAFPLWYLPTSVFFSDALTGSLTIELTGIYKTIDGGVSWIPKSTSFASQYLNSLHFPTSNVGYGVGYDSIFKTTDMGETWNAISTPSSLGCNSVFFTSVDTGYAAGGDGISTGIIRKTVDGGLNWALSNTNTYTFQSIHFPNSNTGYACGQSGVIYKYSLGAGINDFQEMNGVSIFPNPSNGTFKLSIDNFIQGEKYKIAVVDVLGNVIQETELSSNSEFDISGQAKGIYFVRVESKNGLVVKKVVME